MLSDRQVLRLMSAMIAAAFITSVEGDIDNDAAGFVASNAVAIAIKISNVVVDVKEAN